MMLEKQCSDQNGESCEKRSFTRLFVSEQKQIAMMADEKSPARNSHRYFATKQFISLEKEKCENP